MPRPAADGQAAAGLIVYDTGTATFSGTARIENNFGGANDVYRAALAASQMVNASFNLGTALLDGATVTGEGTIVEAGFSGLGGDPVFAMPAPQGGTGSGRDSDMPSAPAPVGKRIFSKLKLVAALKAADKWVLVKTWLEEKAYYDYYLAAQNFAEDNELFVEGRTAIKNYLGMTDEQIEAILSQCIAD